MGAISCFLDPKAQPVVSAVLEWSKLSPVTQQHLKVSRIKDGEHVRLLDGRGTSWELVCQGKTFQVLSRNDFPRPSPEIHLYLSPPSNDALAQSVQQATEMGVHGFHFFRSDFCQWKKSKPLPLERLARVAAAACEQCQQPWLPEFDSDFYGSLQEAKHQAPETTFFCNEDSTQNLLQFSKQVERLPALLKGSSRINIVVGPEGGWSGKEQAWGQEHCELLALGPHILRVPTACVAACALVRQFV